jgi:hypothetical protein
VLERLTTRFRSAFNSRLELLFIAHQARIAANAQAALSPSIEESVFVKPPLVKREN